MKATLGLIGAAFLALAGCGRGDEERGGVTAEESRQLDEAARMLDEAPNALVAPDETGLDNEGEDVAGEEMAGNEGTQPAETR